MTHLTSPLSVRSLLALALFTALFAPSPAVAQEDANVQRGFAAEKVYAFGDVDSVNLFNGNLVLTIPIGGGYSINGGLGYGLKLVYNSNLWDFQAPAAPGGGTYTAALISQAFNAGPGWTLSLGRFFAPLQVGNPATYSPYVYVAEDGGQHEFYGSLHVGETASTTTLYSRDESYLRVRLSSLSGGQYLVAEVESPDGSIRKFSRASSAYTSAYQLDSVRDRFGNQLTVTYSANRWTLTDGHRTHYVDFANRTVDGQTVSYVSQVDLATFGGARALYGFAYTNVTFDRHGEDTAPLTEATVTAAMLTAVTLPDGSAWKVLSHHTTQAAGPGLIQRLELPTLGKLEWAYQTYLYPQRTDGPGGQTLSVGKNYGVATKRVLNAAGGCDIWEGIGCQTTYVPQNNFGQTVTKRTVNHPTGDETVHHFSQPFNVNYPSWTGWEYGLPFTTATTDGSGRYLSQEIYDGTAATGVKKRSVYLRYEHDKIGQQGSTYIKDWYNSNRRVASEKTVFHDDGAKYAEVTRTGFDGLGHYRTQTTSGNFGAGDARTAFTNHNPSRGTYVVNLATNDTTGSTHTAWPATRNWVLGTFTDASATEGGVTAKSDVCFENAESDTMNGFLLRKRTMKGTAAGANDLVTTFARDTAGNVVEERSYGGDTQALATTAALCSLALPADKYFVRHTYAGGSRASSQWQTTGGVGLGGAKFLDLTIDVASGLPSSSRDTASVQTALIYDSSGRLTWERPTTGNGAWTEYRYNKATTSTAANVEIFHSPNGLTTGSLAQSRVFFDPFGRVWRDQKLGEDGFWSTVDTVWNAMGWRRSTTERMVGWPSQLTIFKDFDPFGRPMTIQPPNGATLNVTLNYAGTREVSRTVKVNATKDPATTIERYDRQGRLYQVVEPSGVAGANTTTTYGYDVGGRLVTVSTSSQTRNFSYDNRGLLNWECHPEKGGCTNGSGGFVRYLDYDALGNPGRKVDSVTSWNTTLPSSPNPPIAPVDLRFTYDRASRLTQLVEAGGDLRLLKAFTYPTANSGGNLQAGKISTADRYNYLKIGPGTGSDLTVLVRETYVYAGKGGRVSSRDTQTWVGTTQTEGFTQGWEYNDLGDIQKLTYPRCTHTGCNGAALTSRTVDFTYTRGWLKWIGQGASPIYASSITYHPNGMVNQVAHANGVTYTQGLDPNSMRRPASYATSGAATNWTSGTYAFDGTGNVTAIGSNTYTYDKVSRLLSANQYDGSTSGTGTQRTQAAEYDLYGNVTKLTTNSSILNLGTSTTSNRLTVATYDAAGSMLAWNGNLYAYEPLGMTRRVESSSIEYDHIYTADDERLWTYSPGNPSRFAVRDLDGKVLREFKLNGSTWTVERDYVYRDGVLLAAVLPTGAVNHFHPDHLGTPRLITGAGGAFVAYHLYHPYGAEATAFNQDTERMKFTGHERDLGLTTSAADDLDYMHARYYNMQIGRFLAVDPVSGNPKRPQTWNRYAYVLGNPLRNVDPTGRLTGSAMAEAAQGAIHELKDELTYGLSDGSIFGIVASTATGAVLDGASGIVDVLRVGESTGDAVGSGAGSVETLKAVGVDTVRAASIAFFAVKGLGLLLPKGPTTVIGKLKDLESLGPRDRTLLKHLPNQGSPRANWAQNSRVLRQEMAKGRPIRDASVNPNGTLRDNTGFLRAERNLLQTKGWAYSPSTHLWSPP